MSQALLIVDLQNDFLPGGALAVPHGDEIIDVINHLMNQFNHVYTTRDCHSKGHISFASYWKKPVSEVVSYQGVDQVLWPDHCVENTPGFDYPSSLNRKKITDEFFKGTDPQVESYSIFLDQFKNKASPIDAYLKKHNIKTLYIVGLATDYCVKQTVLDARSLGYEVFVIQDGCKAINLHPEDEANAFKEMEAKGAQLINSSELLKD